ncbi:MAG: pyridoxal phosphate-dependent aminotransferase [Candidatus Omnitrophota bacterium]
MQVARRVKNIKPSLTLEVTSLAKKMKAEGKSVIDFAAGEPDFDTPEYIKNAAIEAIHKGFTKYTPATGFLKLKEAITAKLERDNGLKYLPEQIVVSCGAKHTLYNLLQVLCEEGDEVIFSSPYWVSYPEMVNLSGARSRIIEADAKNDFKLNKENLKANINKKTKVFIINSPGNPTGLVYSREELVQLAETAMQYGLCVISDEIYEKLIFDGKKHVSFASLSKEIYARTIIVNGVSKSYAMTGWRIGYMAGSDAQIIKSVGELQSHSTSNPCSISQMAALAAINNTEHNQMQAMVEEFEKRRDCMLSGLQEIPRLSFVRPEGAFYVFCNISRTGLNSADFSQRLLREAEVAAVAGEAFGRDDSIRLSFATNIAQISEGTKRLKQWVAKL